MSDFSLEIPALEATVGVLDTSLTEYATLRSSISTSLEALTSDDAWSGNGRDAFKKNVQEWLGHFDTYYAQMEAMYNTLKDTVLPAAEALNKQALGFDGIMGGAAKSAGERNVVSLSSGSGEAKGYCKTIFGCYDDHLDDLVKAKEYLSDAGVSLPGIFSMKNAIDSNQTCVDNFRTGIAKYESGVEELEGLSLGEFENFTYPAGWDSERLNRTMAGGGGLSIDDLNSMSADGFSAFISSLWGFYSEFAGFELEGGLPKPLSIEIMPGVTFYMDYKAKWKEDGKYGSQMPTLKAVLSEHGIVLSSINQKLLQAGGSSADLKFDFNGKVTYCASTKVGDVAVAVYQSADLVNYTASTELRATTTLEQYDSNSVTSIAGLKYPLDGSKYPPGNASPAYAYAPASDPLPVMTGGQAIVATWLAGFALAEPTPIGELVWLAYVSQFAQ